MSEKRFLKSENRGAKIFVAVGALVLPILLVVAACTAFDDVPPPAGRDAATRTVDSGTPPEAAADAGPAFTAPGFLSVEEAAILCSQLAACRGLGLSLTQDFRVPLNSAGYSYCVTQLATTFEPNRLGRDLVTATLKRIIAHKDSSCQLAFNELEDQALPENDPLCAGADAVTARDGRCLDATTVLWCERQGGSGTLSHCGKPNGGPTETCVAYDGGAICSPGGLCPRARCDGNMRKGYVELLGGGTDPPHLCSDVDCAAIGLTCVEDSFNTVGCTNGDRVTGVAKQAGGFCEGDVYLARAYVYEGRIDCTALGARCISRAELALCALEDAECSPFGPGVDSCKTGTDVVELCVGGRRQELDCSKIGKRCLPDSRPDGIGSLCR